MTRQPGLEHSADSDWKALQRGHTRAEGHLVTWDCKSFWHVLSCNVCELFLFSNKHQTELKFKGMSTPQWIRRQQVAVENASVSLFLSCLLKHVGPVVFSFQVGTGPTFHLSDIGDYSAIFEGSSRFDIYKLQPLHRKVGNLEIVFAWVPQPQKGELRFWC